MTSVSAPHISSGLDSLLSDFRHNALMMASLTERSLDRAWKGLSERDEDWCNTVIADDEEIDSLEVSIDHEGISLMLRFQPVASDLRHVISTTKLGVNLERVADQAVNIARRTRKLIARPPVNQSAEMEPLHQAASAMLNDAVRSFADSNAELARSLKERDRHLDELNRTFAERMTEVMSKDVENIPTYMDLIFIARSFERIGDLAKTIGEDVVYAVSAEDTRHA